MEQEKLDRIKFLGEYIIKHLENSSVETPWRYFVNGNGGPGSYDGDGWFYIEWKRDFEYIHSEIGYNDETDEYFLVWLMYTTLIGGEVVINNLENDISLLDNFINFIKEFTK